MVHKVDEGSGKFAHVGFDKVGPVVQLGGQICQVSSDDLIKISLFVSLVKGLQSVGKETEGAADEDSARIHTL